VASLRAAVDESLAYLATRPAGSTQVFGPRVVPVAEQRAALERLRARLVPGLTPEALEAAVREDFEVLEAAGAEDRTVLFTGYYEPTLAASLTPREGYGTPILGPPADAVEVPLAPFADKLKEERLKGERLVGRLEGKRLVPYWTRADIAAGKLAGRGLELAWAADPVDLFFAEVQGSATLLLPDGSEKRIGYAGSNGHLYRSIGSLLIREGALAKEAVSMQTLRAWLAAHPGEQQRVLEHNASYVFFRFLEGGALGALGRPVTPGRSIATDLRLFPRGALAFLQTERPVAAPPAGAGPGGDAAPDAAPDAGTPSPPGVSWRPLTRFVLNQDTGGAIRGAGRVDVFWGRGPEAALAAGMMKQPGRLFFLVPRPKP
jgi:membrane-bound lytic murein transglycosylase A